MSAETPFWCRPCAAAGLLSYRYETRSGNWVMIGAKDDADALREAQRSLAYPVDYEHLQSWQDGAYAPVLA